MIEFNGIEEVLAHFEKKMINAQRLAEAADDPEKAQKHTDRGEQYAWWRQSIYQHLSTFGEHHDLRSTIVDVRDVQPVVIPLHVGRASQLIGSHSSPLAGPLVD